MSACLNRAVYLRRTAAAVLVLTIASACLAQDAQPATADARTLQELVARIDRLERRVKELEAEKALSPVTAGASLVTSSPSERSAITSMSGPTSAPMSASMAEPKAANGATEQDGSESLMERMDVSKTLLRIRGFGDVSLHGGTKKGDTPSFSLGQLDLFVTSDISDRFRFVTEIVFEGGPDNIYGVQKGEKNSFSVDLERYLIQYSQNDYFNVSIGRGHTAIGYYNNAYHHSSWLQTGTGRPFLFDFEDRGGILPIHMVGVSVSGQVPAAPFGLHYIAEVGNGRASRTPLLEDPVQNVVDDQDHKAWNLALFSRPEGVRGFQAGLSFYRDVLAPQNQPRVGESILAGHVILVRPRYEWLNEAVLDRHGMSGSHLTFHTPGFYSQVSRQFGSYRPYMRYQYLNVSDREPIFPDVGLRHGPSFGLRYDANESVALKLQYDYTMTRSHSPTGALGMQMGFTF